MYTLYLLHVYKLSHLVPRLATNVTTVEKNILLVSLSLVSRPFPIFSMLHTEEQVGLEMRLILPVIQKT